MDCSLPGFSVHEISQARILKWVAISFSITVSVFLFLISAQRAKILTKGGWGTHLFLWQLRKMTLYVCKVFCSKLLDGFLCSNISGFPFPIFNPS